MFKAPIKYDHGATKQNADKNIFYQVMLVFDTLQCQQYTKTHTTLQKTPKYRNEYICFQTDGRTALGFWDKYLYCDIWV